MENSRSHLEFSSHYISLLAHPAWLDEKDTYYNAAKNAWILTSRIDKAFQQNTISEIVNGVQTIIPNSRLAQYGNYQYDWDIETMYERKMTTETACHKKSPDKKNHNRESSIKEENNILNSSSVVNDLSGNENHYKNEIYDWVVGDLSEKLKNVEKINDKNLPKDKASYPITSTTLDKVNDSENQYDDETLARWFLALQYLLLDAQKTISYSHSISREEEELFIDTCAKFAFFRNPNVSLDSIVEECIPVTTNYEQLNKEPIHPNEHLSILQPSIESCDVDSYLDQEIKKILLNLSSTKVRGLWMDDIFTTKYRKLPDSLSYVSANSDGLVSVTEFLLRKKNKEHKSCDQVDENIALCEKKAAHFLGELLHEINEECINELESFDQQNKSLKNEKCAINASNSMQKFDLSNRSAAQNLSLNVIDTNFNKTTERILVPMQFSLASTGAVSTASAIKLTQSSTEMLSTWNFNFQHNTIPQFNIQHMHPIISPNYSTSCSTSSLNQKNQHLQEQNQYPPISLATKSQSILLSQLSQKNFSNQLPMTHPFQALQRMVSPRTGITIPPLMQLYSPLSNIRGPCFPSPSVLNLSQLCLSPPVSQLTSSCFSRFGFPYAGYQQNLYFTAQRSNFQSYYSPNIIHRGANINSTNVNLYFPYHANNSQHSENIRISPTPRSIQLQQNFISGYSMHQEQQKSFLALNLPSNPYSGAKDIFTNDQRSFWHKQLIKKPNLCTQAANLTNYRRYNQSFKSVSEIKKIKVSNTSLNSSISYNHLNEIKKNEWIKKLNRYRTYALRKAELHNYANINSPSIFRKKTNIKSPSKRCKNVLKSIYIKNRSEKLKLKDFLLLGSISCKKKENNLTHEITTHNFSTSSKILSFSKLDRFRNLIQEDKANDNIKYSPIRCISPNCLHNYNALDDLVSSKTELTREDKTKVLCLKSDSLESMASCLDASTDSENNMDKYVYETDINSSSSEDTSAIFDYFFAENEAEA